MRSAAGTLFGRLAIIVGVAALAPAVAVPIALGRARPAGPVTNYLKYVGGKAGKANPKLSPVVIGAINTQGGQVLVGPNWTKGAELAVKYINTYLGGVHGHPVNLSECFTTSAEEEGTKCGQRFANDKRSRSSCSAPSRSATSRSTPRSAARSRSSAASSFCRSTRPRRTVRPLRDERLGARPVGHVRQERPQGEDGRGRSTRRSRGSTTARRSRRRASSRRGSRRSSSDSTRTRPTSPVR